MKRTTVIYQTMTGCATYFKDYENEVPLRGAYENMRVATLYGLDIPDMPVSTNRVTIQRDDQGNIVTVDWNYENRILLRLKRERALILMLKYGLL